MIKDIPQWLKSDPLEEEVVELQNGTNKVKVIPEKTIETLLDDLTEQNWSTRNFQLRRWREEEVRAVGKAPSFITMCDASLELVVTYKIVVPISPYEKSPVPGQTMKEIEITRVLVGAVSFDCSFFGNNHTANTAKSLCITNAASDLGRRFGKDLNPSVTPVMEATTPGKNKISDTLSKISKK